MQLINFSERTEYGPTVHFFYGNIDLTGSAVIGWMPKAGATAQ